MFKFLSVLLASLCVAYAEVKTVPLEPIPPQFKYQVGCYIEELNEVIAVGESIDSKTSCMKYVCHRKFIKIHKCNHIIAYPPCKIEEHKDQPYPLCCPRVIC